MVSRLKRADIVVSPTVQAIINKLDHPLLQRKFGSTWGVERELQVLYRTMERIKAILQVVENKQMKDELLKLCLEDLRSEAYYLDDVLDEFLIETRKLGDINQVPFSLSFALNKDDKLYRKQIGPFITEINEKLSIIEKRLEKHYFQGPCEEEQYKLLTRIQSFPLREGRRMVGSIVDERHVFGREEDEKNVKEMLLSDQYDDGRDGGVSVVAIVAMGGMGKTTLAQLLYNDPDITNHFEEKAWVCVSVPFDIERITKEILNYGADQKSFPQLQLAVQKKLKGKRILIVLDDVWTERSGDWDKLCVAFKGASRGSRVLVTSRSKKVSSIMNAANTYNLKALSKAVGWSLFKDCAFIDPNTNAYPNLEAIGNGIVNKCDGLPLAIKTLGGLLNGAVDEEAWLSILESEMWDIEEDDILPALSLSYYHLPPHLKQCFAYCSLFPKGYTFRKRTLVQLWVAEGFVQTKQVERKEDIGLQYFDDLLHRSFFQPIFDNFAMHDLMHDLACSVSTGMCFRLEQNRSYDISEKGHEHISLMANDDFDLGGMKTYKLKSLSPTFQFVGEEDVQGSHHLLDRKGFVQTKQVLERRENIGLQYYNYNYSLDRSLFKPCRRTCDRSYDIGEKVRHISLVNVDFDMVVRESYKFKSLSTFQYVGADVQGSHLFDGLFFEFKCLRVLVLVGHWMQSLPYSIGYLKHLSYLSICSITLKTLPESMCMLYNLQVLDIVGCKDLVELPKHITNLSNLQYLKMQHKWWEAKRRPKRLGKLTCLKRIPFFDVGKEADENIGELKELMNLERCLTIRSLQNAKDVKEGDAYLMNMEKIDQLQLKWDSLLIHDRIVALQPPKALNSLDMMHLPGFSYPTWMTTDLSAYDKLGRRVLKALQPPKGLKSLEIMGFPCFSYPTWMTTDLSGYNKLVSVTLKGQSYTLPSLGQLPSLEYLEIISGRMRKLSYQFFRGTGGMKGFQKLTSLKLYFMQVLEDFCDAEDGEFPSLEHLTVENCPILRRLPRLFPSKEQLELKLHYCNSLTSLYCGPNTSFKQVEVTHCNGIPSLPS
ncbi:putative disease resistance protein RGA3 [Macadamia integrifolia]|uniref:putative disease resistance protein RGA3 n=1 Tax=Macadamia integrifolia TaxID=60698 RepID=UPI001C4F2DBE|nr:putative disease resistance protein RGA3 [Macadamia integrifolia]XP_042488327.1 putative disease resistance protein RGA3 [Macadamia integrifolia]XP_042488328.1 putative disease resistance protein RGA3 [Macadamia integrifolia]XP_042488329.1 putative disease resistance protein RGA3 [Macadamia integrifolia]